MAKVKLRASVSTAFLASCIAWAAWQAGCGSSSDGENGGAAFPGEGDSGTPVEDGTTPLLYDADLFGGDSPGPVGVREVHHHRGLLRRTERLRLPQRALCASDAQVT